MRRLARGSWLITLITVAAAGAVLPGTAAAAPAHATATKWTKIYTDTGLGIASAGLFRTPDGKLHVAWAQHGANSYSLHSSPGGGTAKLLAAGTILQKGTGGVSFYPRLVAGPGGGIR